ncbi:MAG TPA: nicotinate-nucleotide adenylyltransferase [Salinivirgaceae bacterium]|nr:nicotinate-nucleotide adenylyltransferase [Salinivirgaceae bacterium]
MEKKQQIGLFFGTFNPIHVGHLVIANYIKVFGNLSEVWFVVTPQSPFKKDQRISDDRNRLEMVHLAIDKSPGYRASDVEFKMPKPSYTIDTVTYLKEKYYKHNFSLIMGADNLQNLHKWKNSIELLRQCPILVYPRPGFPNENPHIAGDIRVIDAPLIEISSSFIRQSIVNQQDVRFFLPSKVWKFIEDTQFYR